MVLYVRSSQFRGGFVAVRGGLTVLGYRSKHTEICIEFMPYWPLTKHELVGSLNFVYYMQTWFIDGRFGLQIGKAKVYICLTLVSQCCSFKDKQC